MPSSQSSTLIPLNIGLGICLAALAWIARMSPLFGEMYEGIGNRLPLITRGIYHPALYLGVPILLCALSLVFNLALPKEHPNKLPALASLLVVSFAYTLFAGIGLYLPIINASSIG